MATFVIAPINDLELKEVNGLLPNYSNTLSCDEEFEGVVNGSSKQKFISSDKIRNQIRTDYDTALTDTIEANLINSSGISVVLSVFKVKQVTDPLNNEVIYYEFETTGLALDTYYATIKATKSGEENIYYQSEPFEVVESVTAYRYGADGTKFPYEMIPNHFKILASNNDNQVNTYWGDDRLVGDPFEVNVWVEGSNRKPQPAGEVDNYDNNGNLAVLKSISQRAFELKTSDIPVHLAFKTSILSKLDNFYINNEKYVADDNFEFEYFANYTYAVLTGAITQSNVVGENSDDQGYVIIDSNDMAGIETPTITNSSGSQQLTISGGYSLNQITVVRTSAIGTQFTVTIGFTPGGNEIMRSESFGDDRAIDNIARNYVNPEDVNASFPAYIEISGVGAAATVILQTIPNKQF